jgi:small subunit ribosomal protein S21
VSLRAAPEVLAPLPPHWARLVGEFLLVTRIIVEEGEPIDRALKRFKKECQKAGIPAEVRRREYFEKPSVRRKRKQEAAIRKLRRRMMKLKKRFENI